MTPSTFLTWSRTDLSIRNCVGSPDRSADLALVSALSGTTRISAPRRYVPSFSALLMLLRNRVAVNNVHDTTATMANKSQVLVDFLFQVLESDIGNVHNDGWFSFGIEL